MSEEQDEKYISFPAYIMRHMHEPGEDAQALVERVIGNLWQQSDHAHVFVVDYVPPLGTFEAVWVGRTEEDWSAWLARREIVLEQTIAATIEALEAEANRESGTDD